MNLKSDFIMKIIQDINQIKEGFSLAIGNFDGVHLGHREIIKNMKDDSSSKNLKFCIITFKPHPQKILNPSLKRFLITSYQKKAQILQELGVDFLVEISFDRDFSTLSAEEFAKKYLASNFNLKKFYAGYDFAFGKNKSGDINTLKKIADGKFKIDIQMKVDNKGRDISSTIIRNKLKDNKIEECNELLGRNYSLEGLVIKGEGRGKKIGFPTANLMIDEDFILPEKGVYVTSVIVDGLFYNSVTNIGSNPTFNNGECLHVETNIFDFQNDIYGENLEVIFYKKIREERKFPNVNELINQIKQDIIAAKEFHEKNSANR